MRASVRHTSSNNFISSDKAYRVCVRLKCSQPMNGSQMNDELNPFTHIYTSSNDEYAMQHHDDIQQFRLFVSGALPVSSFCRIFSYHPIQFFAEAATIVPCALCTMHATEQ